MPRIKYVGTKEDGEAAFADLTGIKLWKPGDAHDIPSDALAHRMLQHPDVFALDKGKGTSPAPVAAPAPVVPPPPPPTVAGEMGGPVGATRVTEGAGAGLSLAPGTKVDPAAPPPPAPAPAPAAAKKTAAKSTGKPAAKGASKK